MREKTKNCRQIIVKNRPLETESIFLFLDNYMQENKISKNSQNDLRLAIEETFINIVSYAYPKKNTEDIIVSVDHTAHTISITFTDNGKAFNPLADAKNFNKNNEHVDGGMGIHLIKSLTDKQIYKRTNQTNVFTLTKHYTN